VNNVIFIEFFNKSNFPNGVWSREPDYCKWVHSDLLCLAIRDMSLGVWRGFVGVDNSHPLYAHSLENILEIPDMMTAFLAVYGGICSAGKLPARYKKDAKTLWWLGMETCHGGDYMPLIVPDDHAELSTQTYKDFFFIRRETNKLAEYVSKVK
jgi:hypothetical protein